MRAVVDTSYLIEFIQAPFEKRFQWMIDADLATTTLLSYEFHNVLLKALKVETSNLDKFHRILANLKIEYADIIGREKEIYALSSKYGLSFYDASYLWLAAKNRLPIATYDKQILQAAASVNVKTIA